jgi:glycosyltransferase involved in cell wall biosynthesis
VKIVHTESSCGWGGQEIRILEEARGLAERGHHVHLLCPPEARIFEEAPRFGVKVTPLPIARKHPYGVISLRNWLKEHKHDVINTHSSTDTWLTALACTTLRNAPPIVRTRHISAPVPSNAATNWLYTRATKHIVTTGESLRRQLIEQNGYPAANITSAPTGIDPERYAQGLINREMARTNLATVGLSGTHPLLVIVATLRSWKGHVYLLEALAGLPDVRLAVVGDGPYRPTIEQKVVDLGLADRVFFAGQQSDVAPWLRAADIFVLPSYANEGVPQAILQAMMSKLPVVSTTVGAITEAVTDGITGRIVPPRDAPALRAALSGLLAAPKTAATLGNAGRERAVALFSRDAMLDRMESVFVRATRA